MANVNLKYQDGQNWTNVNGQIINWTNLSEHYKDERVQPQFVPYTVVTDIWGGVSHKVQEITHDAWRLEFYIKESEVHDINRMLSCATVLITDIDNDLNHVADTSPDQLELTEPERINTTSNFKVVLVYKTNKTVINKFDALDNEVTLVGDSTYYSKYEKLSYNGELEEIRVQWGEGGEKLLQETNDTGYKVLLYLSDSEKESFKNDWNQNTFTIDSTDIIRKLPLEITELGEDNNQVIVSCIIVRETINSTLAMPTASTLTKTSTTYNSVFELIDISSEVESIFAPLSNTGIGQRLLREAWQAGQKQLFYLDEDDLSSFKTAWQTVETDDWDFNGVQSIVEKLPLEIEEMPSGLYKVIVSGWTNNSIVHTEDLTPNNTHDLDIDSGTHFYTDYPLIQSYQDTGLDQENNEDGVNITSKAITRKVTLVKLFLNEADTYSLKQLFEKSTDIEIDSVPVLENRIVSETELAYDLYEVNVECLVTATVTNPL